MHQPLDEHAFAGVFRAGDSRRFGIDLKKDRAAIVSSAIAAANASLPAFGPIHKTISNGRKCHSVKDYSQTLILRILAIFLSRRFRIEINNRDRMVRGVIEALSDSTPIYLVRRDVSSFYETIPTVGLTNRLTHNTFIPTLLRRHFDSFFNTFCPAGTNGVPRGICVSPLLAELEMESFDKAVRRLPGVYRYFRYSDDILIFSHIPTGEIESKIAGLLPQNMSFNDKKSCCIALNCSNKTDQKSETIEYLGYSYTVSNLCGDKDPREVNVSISARKIAKLKTRVFRCFKAYEKDKNFELLRDRIKFLSGNYTVQRHGATSIKSSRFVKSGIFYNYKLCGTYSKGGFKAHEAPELKCLDGIYQSLIKPTCSFGSKLNAPQRQELKEISFFKGFELKITTRFAPDRVAEMKRAWRNG